MFANPYVNQIILLVFMGLLLAAAVEDLRRLLIPNRYCLAIALLYPIHVLASPAPVDWSGGLMVGAGMLALGFVAFARGWFGGGDAKLLAAASPWAGPSLLPEFVFLTALAGGALAIAMLIQRRLSAPIRVQAAGSLPARMRVTMTIFLGNLLLARGRFAAGTASASASSNGSAAIPDDVRSGGNLPYGVAICAGGLAVAAMLMMRG